MIVLEVEGTRGRGRHKRRMIDSVKEDLREKGLIGGKFEDREERGLRRVLLLGHAARQQPNPT